MTTIQQFFQQAQLAEASYTLFDKINYTDSGQVQAALDVANKANFNGSFSATQATTFVSQWRVVNHIPDTASGFSATLFERLNGKSVSKPHCFAIG